MSMLALARCVPDLSGFAKPQPAAITQKSLLHTLVHPSPVSHLKADAAPSASQTCSALPGTICISVSCCIAAGLYAGSTELTRDFATVVLRIYSLGFNSIRLLTSFTTLFTLPAVPQGSSCTPVDVATIQSFVTDPNDAPTSDAFFPQTLQVRHGFAAAGQLSLLMQGLSVMKGCPCMP